MKRRMLLCAVIALGLTVLSSPVAAQLPESTVQMKLARDTAFLDRVQYLMVQAARVVLNEETSCVGTCAGTGPYSVACHSQRTAYARGVKDNPGLWAVHASVMLVGGTNVIGTVTYNPGPPETVSTTVTDGALFSQINTFWSALAGCEIPPS